MTTPDIASLCDRLLRRAQNTYNFRDLAGLEADLREAATRLRAVAGEPEAWMFQHDETGRMTICPNDGVNTPKVFAELNPRYALIGPLYTRPQPATPATVTDEDVAWPSGVLNRDATIRTLTEHNAWRRGARGPQTDPVMLGKALDAAIAALESFANKERE